MKRLVFLVLAAAIGYLIYTLNQKPSVAHPFAPYQLDELASKPLPKSVFLDGVHFYAEDLCKDSQFLEIVKVDKDTCLTHVSAHRGTCLATIAAVLPVSLGSKDQVSKYSEQYLQCVTPEG